jgi:hypothetical protein
MHLPKGVFFDGIQKSTTPSTPTYNGNIHIASPDLRKLCLTRIFDELLHGISGLDLAINILDFKDEVIGDALQKRNLSSPDRSFKNHTPALGLLGKNLYRRLA